MISVYELSTNVSSLNMGNIFLNELENLTDPVIYDKIQRSQRSDYGQREPKFVGFAIQDDSIEIDMEIAVPFLSVPRKNGVGTRSRNFANINVAAVILAGFVAVAGTFFGGAARFFNGGNFFDGKPIFKRKAGNKDRSKRDEEEDSFVMKFMDNIDNSLKNIGFDSSACLARSLCWHVKDSNLNVIEKRAEKIDIFIAGFSKSDWIHRAVPNDFLREAIESGGRGLNCEEKYRDCVLSHNNIEKFSLHIQKKAKPKKVKRHQMR